MPDSSDLTETALAASCRSLIGGVLAAVQYCDLEHSVHDGSWDFDDWHSVEMGVEVELVDGRRFCAVWGDAFGHFNIELREQRLGEVLRLDSYRLVDMSAHPAWAPLMGRRVDGCDVLRGAITDRDWAPNALRLVLSDRTLWIYVAELADTGNFIVGMDCLTIAFDPTVAAELEARRS